MSFICLPPSPCYIKANFDVAIIDSFVVAVVVLSDDQGKVIMAATQKLHSTDALYREALAALLAVRLAVSLGCFRLVLE